MLSFRNIRVLVVVFLMACGSSADDVIGDSGGGTDATTDQNKNDSTTNDSPVDSPGDSTIDSSDDVSIADDGGIIDAPVLDAPVKDSGINGCTSNNDCNNNQYCEKGTNNCAGVGQCLVKPTICPQIYKPVCGCDKQTHSNDCYAHASGTSVWYTSACE